MALDLRACMVPASDCSGIYIYNQTGAHSVSSNPGGLGAPNFATSDATTAVLSVLYAGATVATDINVYPTLVTTNTAAAYFLSLSALGLTSFPQGLTRLTLSIGGMLSGSPVTYSVTHSIVVDCELRCAVNNELYEAAMHIAEGCTCDDEAILGSIFMAAALDGAEIATCCGNETDANTLFEFVNDLSSSGGCGCS